MARYNSVCINIGFTCLLQEKYSFNSPVFVGHWPQENTVIVAHQGTDPLELWVLFYFGILVILIPSLP